MNFRKLFLATLVAIALMVSTVPGSATADAGLAATIVAWQEAFDAGDFEAISSIYTTDACRMPPNQEAVEGTEAIMANIAGAKEAGAAMVELAVTNDTTSNEMGWGSGTYKLLKEDGTVMDEGKWMNVNVLVDGAWKIKCDIWNSNLPLAE